MGIAVAVYTAKVSIMVCTLKVAAARIVIRLMRSQSTLLGRHSVPRLVVKTHLVWINGDP
jgi:hypothetical protein